MNSHRKLMNDAFKVAEQSKSRIVKVGAVLAFESGDTLTGYNGEGFKGELEYEPLPGRSFKDLDTFVQRLQSKPGVIHAEESVIGKAAAAIRTS